MFDSFNFWFLWAALALDVATTWYVLERGGMEVNPLLRIPVKYIGMPAALIGSHALVAVMAWLYGASAGPRTLWILTALFAAASAWNGYVIFTRMRA